MTQAPPPSRHHHKLIRGGSFVLILVLVLLLKPTAPTSDLLSPAFFKSRSLSSSPPHHPEEEEEAVVGLAQVHSGSPLSPALNENHFHQLEEDLLKKPELTDSDLHQLFDGYKQAFSKNYKPKEDMEHRFKLFVATVERVRSHNAAAAIGEYSYTMGLTEFADMTQDEKTVAETPQAFNVNNDDDDYYCDDYENNLGEEHLLLNGGGVGNVTSRSLLAGTNTTSTPDLGVHFEQYVHRARKTVNWVEQGAVTQPGDQGGCGSCWAFATMAAVESARFKKTGVLEKLAVQPLVDCLPRGCNGKQPLHALNKILEWGGLLTEASYPYTGKAGKCRFDEYEEEDMVELPFDEWRAVKDDEPSLKLAIGQHPGVVVNVRISREEIHGYRGGIYDGCEKLASRYFSKSEDGIAYHAMQLVGYGSEGEGESKAKYWLLKNSWGDSRGENGYMRILRGSKRAWKRGFRKGNCDITSYAIVLGKMKRFLGQRLGREAAWEDREKTARMMLRHHCGSRHQLIWRRKGNKNKKKRQKKARQNKESQNKEI